MLRRQNFLTVALLLVTGLAFALLSGVGQSRTAQAGARASDPPSGSQRAQEFIAAFNRGDAKALVAFWSPDGNYVDPNGVEVRGREALEQMYANLFAELKGARLAVTVTSSRAPNPDVRLEEGISELKFADGSPPSLARFSAVLVKKEEGWLMESLRESAVAPPSNGTHLAELAWLIGDWEGENEKGVSGTDSFDWAENQNFILSTFATTQNGVPVAGGTRWIAWDAAAKQIRSWSFYSGGGFSEGVWTRSDHGWTIKSTATTGAGKKVSVTQLLTKADADHATWQVTKVTVDGRGEPDPAPMKFKRVKDEQR